jgi:cytosine/adenosine deaminase-related metal-dependent hydrolase
MIRRFSATWVYTLTSPPLKNGIVSVDEKGEIVDIKDTNGHLPELERLEHHSGIIVPGFINAHCHLELSHLKGKLSGKNGIGGFLGEINLLRNIPEEELMDAARKADREMHRQGIVAVGDISNSSLTTSVKSSSPIDYFTFVENFIIDASHWKPTTKNSLESVLPLIAENKKLLLIHNTFTTASEISTLRKLRRTDNVFMVLCPNSNLFIENSLPLVDMFRAEGMSICLGTDSLASNHQLSILSEMVTLQHHFANIELSELLTWACLNGAKALEMDDKLGTLEVGKKPGLLLIKGADMKNHRLNPNSSVHRLV